LILRRGEIYWVDFTPSRGSEQRGLRPALVIQSDIPNAVAAYPMTIVLPLSTQIKNYKSHVLVAPDSQNGLSSPSEVLTGQIVSIDKGRLGDRIGKLSDGDIRRVNETLAYMLSLGS
jgi:mRNA interferase MazF